MTFTDGCIQLVKIRTKKAHEVHSWLKIAGNTYNGIRGEETWREDGASSRSNMIFQESHNVCRHLKADIEFSSQDRNTEKWWLAYTYWKQGSRLFAWKSSKFWKSGNKNLYMTRFCRYVTHKLPNGSEPKRRCRKSRALCLGRGLFSFFLFFKSAVKIDVLRLSWQ